MRAGHTDRLGKKDQKLEWARIVSDLEALDETEVPYQGKRFILRPKAAGTCGKVCRAVGITPP